MARIGNDADCRLPTAGWPLPQNNEETSYAAKQNFKSALEIDSEDYCHCDNSLAKSVLRIILYMLM
jgi:hypothetical protein